jgi:hypothetical protein
MCFSAGRGGCSARCEDTRKWLRLERLRRENRRAEWTTASISTSSGAKQSKPNSGGARLRTSVASLGSNGAPGCARRRTRRRRNKPLDFLAIGDSWFDYPLNGNAPSFGSTAIIAQLTQVGSAPPLVLNYALYGQATTSVLTYKNQQDIIDAVTDRSEWVNDARDGILVSMGGDDLVGDQFAIYLD